MNTERPIPNPETDLLADVTIPLDHASTGQRFLNYMIDNLLMRYGFSRGTGYVVLLVVRYFDSDFLYTLQTGGFSGIFLFWYLLAVINYTVYYTFCEKLFNGYTLGKLITGTKAVREDSQPLTWRNAFLRSVTRLVPLEALSGFGTPWHDSWTGTMVVKTR